LALIGQLGRIYVPLLYYLRVVIMFYQSCGSVGDSYEEQTEELLNDSDAIEQRYAEFHQNCSIEDCSSDPDVKWAIAQAEDDEMNSFLPETTCLTHSGLWTGAEWIVL
jgi:hypothetical protein